MELQQQRDAHGGRFIYAENGAAVASVDYTWEQKVMNIDYVQVNSSQRGRGLGNDIVAAVAEKAREEGFKIRPLCRFAWAVMNRTDRFADVLEK